MATSWHAKKAKLAEAQAARDEEASLEAAARAAEMAFAKDTSAAAMGGGDEQVFEKKMTKEEKKAAAKAAREAKRAAKGKGKKGKKGDEDEEVSEATAGVDHYKQRLTHSLSLSLSLLVSAAIH